MSWLFLLVLFWPHCFSLSWDTVVGVGLLEKLSTIPLEMSSTQTSLQDSYARFF